MKRIIGWIVLAAVMLGGNYAQASESVQDTLRGAKIVYDPIDYQAVGAQLQKASRPTLWQRLTTVMRTPLLDNSAIKNFRTTGRIGLRYAPETSLSIVGAVAGEYSTARGDSSTPLSAIILSADVSLTGYYGIGINGDTFLPKGKDRFIYSLSVASQPIRFWGLGYEAGDRNHYSKYTQKRAEADVRYLRNVVGGLWLGAMVDYQYAHGGDFEPLAESYLAEAYQTARNTSGVGVGLVALYDGRNSQINATQGLYLSLLGQMRPKAFGDYAKNLLHIEAVADFYTPVWQGGVVAADLYANLWSSATPWLLWPSVGGSTRMRGYYYGRYTASKLLSGQVEVRQHIYGPFGACVWGGAAKLFSSFKRFEWKNILPNYGLGVRVALGDGTSLRVDYGFGRHSNELIININEAF